MTGGEVIGEHVDYDEAQQRVDDLISRVWDATGELEAVDVAYLAGVPASALVKVAERLRLLADRAAGD